MSNKTMLVGVKNKHSCLPKRKLKIRHLEEFSRLHVFLDYGVIEP